MQTLVRIGDASRVLGVHPVTLKRWEQAGLVRPLRNRWGVRFYTGDQLVRLRELREPKQTAGEASEEGSGK